MGRSRIVKEKIWSKDKGGGDEFDDGVIMTVGEADEATVDVG